MPGATAAMLQSAPEKVAILFISAVVLPVPPSEADCPLVSMSQTDETVQLLGIDIGRIAFHLRLHFCADTL